jgi:predicted Zn-dependent protease
MTIAQEHKIGEMIMRQIRAAGAYLEDPEVNDYLNELGHRLVAAIPEGRQEFEFFAVADSTVNAFALPGGYVGVNTGLILLAQSESELASVLAHEITHVTQRHMARSISKEKNALLYMLAGLALAIAASRSGSSSSGQATSAAIASGQALALQSQINFTRENEYEADRIGFQRLEAAGFDVYAMATLMDRLQKSSRFADGNAPSYLRSHPVTHERVAEAQSRAFGKPYKQVTDSIEFHLVRALLRSYTGTPREAVAYFRDALTERKFNNEVAARYGLVASLLRNEEFPQAITELAALEKIAPPHPMIEAMAGHVLMESGKLDLAIARFKSALARYPNKLQLIYDYPQALAKAGRQREAAAFLETELARFPQDGPLHRIAATYSDLGQNSGNTGTRASTRWRAITRGGAPVRAGVESGRRRLLPDVGRRGRIADVAQRWWNSRRRSARTADRTSLFGSDVGRRSPTNGKIRGRPRVAPQAATTFRPAGTRTADRSNYRPSP